MKNWVCCFTGHRKIPPEELGRVKERLRQVVVHLIETGVIYFGTGGALGFDTLAAETVLALKNKCPQIRLILVLPCENQTRGWPEADVRRYEAIRRRADAVRVLADHYDTGCMQARNRHLVEHSGVCVCYLKRKTGGTAYTVAYAVRQGLTIYRV